MSACLWGSRGEKRVKEVLNYKKPSFWILLAAVVVCVIVAVCFLTNPKDGTTVVLTNEAGNSEADAATNAALEQAAAKQEEVEQLKESLAAQQESLAEGLDTAKQENTTGIYVENSSYSGFFTAKGYVAYAQMEMGGTSIFLVSDGSYQDGDHTYAISCDVYRVGADAAPEKLGSLESGGTAYPLSSGADGIYVTSGHSIEVYTIDAANGKLGLARSNTEVYDENGNATYYRLDDQGQTVESTEEEYIKEWDIYSKVASPIEFTVQK